MFDFHYKSLLSWYFNKSVDRYYQLRKQVHNIQYYFANLTRPAHLWNIANFFESCKNVQKFNTNTELLNLKRFYILFIILKRITTPDIKKGTPRFKFSTQALSSVCRYFNVRGQSVFFNLALRERNIQVRLQLKVVLKSWDVEILIIRTNFQKSNIGWPQQPQTEKVQKLKNNISWFH